MTNNDRRIWKTAEFDQIIFVDIETGSQYEDFREMNESLQELWGEKRRSILRFKPDSESLSEEDFYFENAGLYAEFGRVLCISVGLLTPGAGELHIKTFGNVEESVALIDFAAFLDQVKNKKQFFCGHNIKEFDVPYLGRRMLANNVPLPPQLDVSGCKPWEIPHIDTMELWKFGDMKSYTSLKLLLSVFGIASPKDDIDGSQVNSVFWKENDLERIVKYCEKDVIAVAQLYLRFRDAKLLTADAIKIREWEHDV
ncbi:MAG: ribonuclease H-like domain-containing protein [Pyrinomonadaceae bacterium]|nr:ribonuclease H-like domain-containing protein [Pyrinomonadaceae bacterium]